MDAMRFVKMQGIGNDYVYVDAFTDRETERAGVGGRDWAAVARAVSDRHFGIGSDGLILVCRPAGADNHVRMRMFNADGSESEMCGNGVRCVAKFAHDRLGVRASPMRVETGAGVKAITYRVEGNGSPKLVEATVDMGPAVFDLARVPADASKLRPTERADEYEITAAERTLAVTCVSMGNPHAVCFVEDVAGFDLERVGPRVETHAAFPKRVNLHVAQVVSPGEIRMRSWERGSGVTLACGTGACAVFCAAVKTGRLRMTEGVVRLPGGALRVRWSEEEGGGGHVFMTGPAVEVFEGEWGRGTGH